MPACHSNGPSLPNSRKFDQSSVESWSIEYFDAKCILFSPDPRRIANRKGRLIGY